MDEQEMQFADPDWQPRIPVQDDAASTGTRIPRPASNNSRPGPSGPSRATVDSLQKFDGYKTPPRQAQKPASPPVSQRAYPTADLREGFGRRLWGLGIFILIALIFALFNYNPSGPATSSSFGDQQSSLGDQQSSGSNSQQTYSHQVGNDTQVEIDYWPGSVTVQTTTGASEIVVSVSDNGVNFTEKNNGILAITAGTTSDNAGSVFDNSITVTLPESIAILNLTATTDNMLEVDNYKGQLTIQSASMITLNDDTLTDRSTINTAISGGSSGLLNDTITLNEVNLSGQVTTNSGGFLYFTGTLDPHGSYAFTTTGGDLGITVPADTSMKIQHSTGSGGSYQSDFPDSTGNPPQATVDLESNGGTITVRKEQ